MSYSKIENQEELDALVAENGYISGRFMEDGNVALLVRLVTTVAVCVGADKSVQFQRRYCYRDFVEAMGQYQELKSINDEPTGWIARRPECPE